MKKLLKYIVIIIILIFAYTITEQSPPHIPKVNTLNQYQYNLNIAINFINHKMINDQGGVYTNYLKSDFTAQSATGHEVLSESQGLLMLHAVYSRDKQLFDKAFSYVKGYMFKDNYGLSWRVAANNQASDTVSASVDDLRVIRALYYADKLWHNAEYNKMFNSLESYLRNKCISNNTLVDFHDSFQTSDQVTLSYLDLKSIELLTHRSNKWDNVFNDSISIIEKAKISPQFPMYYKTYSVNEQQVTKSTNINLIDSLLTILHLAEVNKVDNDSLKWLKSQMKNAGKLMSSYNSVTGEANTHSYESTAVYALAMRICNVLNERDLYKSLANKMIQLQVKNNKSEVYGGFADEESLKAYSFDNLQAILALEGR